MKYDEEKIISTVTYISAFFLSSLLFKYVFYDNGFSFLDIILLVGLFYTRFLILGDREPRQSEGACLILFILFDKSLLDVGNLLLLTAVVFIREHLRESKDMKEIVSFICGLIYLLMGWYSVGRVFVIYGLLFFYVCCFGFLFWQGIKVLFKLLAEDIRKSWKIRSKENIVNVDGSGSIQN